MWLKLVNELTQDSLAYEGQRKFEISQIYVSLKPTLVPDIISNKCDSSERYEF